MTKIIDNPSPKEVRDQIRAFESLAALYNLLPFGRRLFPRAAETFAQLQDIKEQAEILLVPDQFNETFSKVGWIAYESMNLDTMVAALAKENESGLAEAEQLLTDYYNEETLNYGIMRFQGHADFRKRVRLAELAKEDYLAGRFHACVPLLLSLLDGLVNDVSKHVGFFAEGANLTAWDSIAAHETGLTALAKIMRFGRNKTNDDPITIPFRNGILHGRDLAFDNPIVAAKCWGALFAVRDWAGALAEGKATAKPKEKVSWSQLLRQIAENKRSRKALDAWRPREATELTHLPHCGPSSALPEGTPERAVAEFLDNWQKGRFGLMADALLDFSNTHKGKKAGRVKEDFGHCTLLDYKLLSVSDEAPAVSHVEVNLVIQGAKEPTTIGVEVRIIYNGIDNQPMTRGEDAGSWKIVQSGFSKAIYEELR